VGEWVGWRWGKTGYLLIVLGLSLCVSGCARGGGRLGGGAAPSCPVLQHTVCTDHTSQPVTRSLLNPFAS
jgi:hypothetical protein